MSTPETTIRDLRQSLAPYFLSFDGTRDLGRGTAFPASADLPSGLLTNDRFYRSDLLLDCVYDGTRWLTRDIFTAAILNQTMAVNTGIAFASLRQDYVPFVTRVTTSYQVATTNNATNYWTITIRGLAAAYNTPANIDTFTTISAGVGTYVQRDAAEGSLVTTTPTTSAILELQALKTLSPGVLNVFCTVYYRLIIT